MTRSTASEPPDGAAPPDAVLDTVGLYCPVPIIKTAEAIRKLGVGEVLEVLSDDRVILVDMPAWCRSTGHEYLGSRRDGNEYRLRVRKRASRGANGGTR
ncbi:MAG: sulfurtransferase TusA family protein [Acidobacteria bacterium]|nr:MAG: sulfurtransferase TusA family protein [Acidobacteriota bacterium]